MTVAKILKDVGQLPASERREVAALLVAKYPPRSVEELVSRAEKEVRQGKWVPTPPNADNISTGRDLRDLNNAIARNKGKPGIPWAQVKKELGID